MKDITFSRPRPNKAPKRKRKPVPTVEDDIDEEEMFRQLKQICPNACVLTKNDSDTDTASDDEDLPQVC